MKQNLFIFLLVMFLPSLIRAQINVDSIFIWDNDRGESNQSFPAVGVYASYAYVLWLDARWGDYDIYRQGLYWNGAHYGPNTMVSIDTFNRYIQTCGNIEGNPNNFFVAVWEDSSYRRGFEQSTAIWACIYTSQPFRVIAGPGSQKQPSVSCRDNGHFVVSYTNYNPGYPSIYYRRYSNIGAFIEERLVRARDSVNSYVPSSCVAFCDSGFMIVYEDSSADGAHSIYAQYRDTTGGLCVVRYKVSNLIAGEQRNEQLPDVAVNRNGNIVVVWQDYRNGNSDIYARRFQAVPTGFIGIGGEIQITVSLMDQTRPKVAVFPNGDFIVVWYEVRGGDYDVYAQVYTGGDLKQEFRVPVDNVNYQGFPDVACRDKDSVYVVWMSASNTNFPDIFCRSFQFNPSSPFGVDPLMSIDIPVIPDTVFPGGRKGWYFDDENYDNSQTTNWDEDPIDEPDSIYADLDSAIIDQITELNTNNQYYIECDDTLPYRSFRSLNKYEAIFIDLGYRTTDASAGVINPQERIALVNYINTAKPTMIEGNDFGSMYDTTTLFSFYHTQYLGDGASYISGNIDTLYGATIMFATDETLKYNYRDLVDNYVDSIRPTDGKLILQSCGAPGDWMAGRAVGWDNSWKRLPGNTVYNTFPLCSIKSTRHPHTYAEYFRRCLGFLRLNCQPEPITTLMAATGSSEGQVDIVWEIVSDDSLAEPCTTGYKLKFARKKMTSEVAFSDSSEEYYQAWNTPGQPGTVVSKTLIGLPPLDILIFALKVKDETGLQNALGDEPRAVVAGDSITPHTITVGNNLVKDFMNGYELIDRRNNDSLFVTWDNINFFVGFARCDFKTDGDLFIYLDTKLGGADSTVPYNGSTGKSWFIAGFRPDYVLIIENPSTLPYYYYKRWVPSKDNRGSWLDTAFIGSFSEDSIINDYHYTEIGIPFTNMRYDTLSPFKLIVLVQNETTNQITNAFPILNPLGSGVYLVQYYQWNMGLKSNLVPNKSYDIIGIYEEKQNLSIQLKPYNLTVFPNPFEGRVDIRWKIEDGRCKSNVGHALNPLKQVQGQGSLALKIYNVSGRLVRQWDYQTMRLSDQILWDGTDDNGNILPDGIYFCELKSEKGTEVIKIICIR